MKRKWQKIVNKGLEYGHHSASSGADAGAIVLDGIKEGVQEVSRLLAAGFSHTTPSSSFTTVPNHSERCLPSFVNKSHCAKESNSSVSICMTSRSGSTPGRFSQSSMSSLGEDRNGALEENLYFEGEEKDDSHGDNESRVQILMVRDTGATPTMSPNPEFHQQKQRQNQNNCVSASLSTMRLNDTDIECVKLDTTGDFKGQTRTCDIQTTAAQVHRRKSREAARLDFEQLDFSSLAPSVLLSRSSNVTNVEPGGLAPMSSIPGFGLTAGIAAVSSPPVCSWMDSMGKKLRQLHRSPTCVSIINLI